MSCEYKHILDQASSADEELRDKVRSLELKIRVLENINADAATDTSTPSLIPDSDPAASDDDQYSFQRVINTNAHGEYNVIPARSVMKPIALVTGDPIVPLLWGFFKLHSQFSSNDMFIKDLKLAKEKFESLNRYLVEHYGVSYIKRLGSNPTRKEILSARKSISHFGQKLGIEFLTDSDLSLLPLIDKARRCLPPYQQILEMVGLFFSRRCPGHCDLRRVVFEKSIRHILLPDGSRGSVKISITKKEDVANLSILLVMLRLVYLLFINPFTKVANKSSPPTPKIYMDAVDIAQELLNELDITIDENLEHLQAILLMFRYRMLAPEYDCYTKSSSATASFSLIHILSKSLQLDEDPTRMLRWTDQEIFDDEDFNFRRILATSINILDIHVSTVYGPSFLSDAKDWAHNASQNSTKLTLDLNEMSNFFTRVSPIIFKTKEICELVLQLRLETKIGQALKLSVVLENMIEVNFPHISQYLSKFDSKKDAYKVQEFNILLTLKCLLLTLYFSFYIYFHNRSETDRSSCYARKFYSIAWIDFSFVSKNVLPIIELLFGPGAHWDIMPLLYACSKLQLISNLIRIRFACTLFNSVELSAFKAQQILFLKQKMKNLEEYAMEFVESLSKVMKCGWWHAKSSRFGQRSSENPQMYVYNPQLNAACVVKFSEEELKNWIKLVGESKEMLHLYETLFGNLMFASGYQPLDNVVYGVTSERELMEIIQFDKMWQLLDIIRSSLSDTLLPRELLKEDEEMWMMDLNLLKEFNLLSNFDSDQWNLSELLKSSASDPLSQHQSKGG